MVIVLEQVLFKENKSIEQVKTIILSTYFFNTQYKVGNVQVSKCDNMYDGFFRYVVHFEINNVTENDYQEVMETLSVAQIKYNETHSDAFYLLTFPSMKLI